MQGERLDGLGIAVEQGGPIMAALEARKQELYEVAIGLVDDWWGEYLQQKKSKPVSERGYLGLRVRQYQSTLAIEYFRSVFFKRAGEAAAKPGFRTIPRGSKLTYTEARLRKERALPWEIELVMEWEPTFELVRRESLILGKLFRYARDIEKTRQALESAAAETSGR